jgi:diaminohydroxyphosphoribosylaminopyrimidine deaminase/5-amino-6-(5-phosphoribosylamino)uracil reductase
MSWQGPIDPQRTARAGREEVQVTERPARGASGALLPEAVYGRALEVGRSAAGVAGPNPPVGCVIVRDGAIVGEGATRPIGGAHAEVVALEQAGDDARGATAVVTLEPCAHHGRTPPCVGALVAAGVREVHLLHRDPDVGAAGGAHLLEASGVTVVDVGTLLPALGAAAAHDLRGFLARVRSDRPHVTLKLAQSPEGSTVPPVGGYLTGRSAREHVHGLRAESDAVLVGGETVRTDDPRLDVRLIGAARQPRPVVMSASGELPLTSRVARAGAIALLGPAATAQQRRSLTACGMTVVPVAGDEQVGLDLSEALQALLEHRILTVLAEPGPRLAAALLEADLVDRVELHVAGGATAALVRPALPTLGRLTDGTHDVERIVTSDGDLILRLDLRAVPDAGAQLAGLRTLEGVT